MFKTHLIFKQSCDCKTAIDHVSASTASRILRYMNLIRPFLYGKENKEVWQSPRLFHWKVDKSVVAILYCCVWRKWSKPVILCCHSNPSAWWWKRFILWSSLKWYTITRKWSNRWNNRCDRHCSQQRHCCCTPPDCDCNEVIKAFSNCSASGDKLISSMTFKLTWALDSDTVKSADPCVTTLLVEAASWCTEIGKLV